MTWVFPNEISTEPVAFGAMSGWKVTGRSWSGVRESERGMGKAESRNGKAERGNDGKLSPAYRLPSGFCFLLSKFQLLYPMDIKDRLDELEQWGIEVILHQKKGWKESSARVLVHGLSYVYAALIWLRVKC